MSFAAAGAHAAHSWRRYKLQLNSVSPSRLAQDQSLCQTCKSEAHLVKHTLTFAFEKGTVSFDGQLPGPFFWLPGDL